MPDKQISVSETEADMLTAALERQERHIAKLRARMYPKKQAAIDITIIRGLLAKISSDERLP
jgi:hypothetical protein